MLHELADYLERTGSILSPDEALGHAVREWIASREDGRVALDVGAAPRRPGGYQWKCLFLAHGSELRFFHDGQFHYAEVRDDLLVHNNRPVSPRQFMLGVIGEPRNAWHELWVRRPSDARWKLTSVLRRKRWKLLTLWSRKRRNLPCRSLSAAVRTCAVRPTGWWRSGWRTDER